MHVRGIERSVPLQFRTEQVVSAYAQYVATASAPRATADTSASLREAKAIISAYGSAQVVSALADIQSAVDALQAAPRTARAQAQVHLSVFGQSSSKLLTSHRCKPRLSVAATRPTLPPTTHRVRNVLRATIRPDLGPIR